MFRDRRQAGRRLAAEVVTKVEGSNALVLALPRGGVPVALEVAKRLKSPLDVLVVRKLGVPGQEELAMGAVASGGVRLINQEVVEEMAIPDAAIEAVATLEEQELSRRERAYRGDRPPLAIEGRTVLLVDDGLATGSTMLAAIRGARQRKPVRLIVAVPVAAVQALDAVRKHADDVICLQTPFPFYAVGAWYEDFSQTTDEEIRDLLSMSLLKNRA